jgi:hypothetical protein
MRNANGGRPMPNVTPQFAEGGPVDASKLKPRKARQWGLQKVAEEVPPAPEKKAKGGAVKRKPKAVKRVAPAEPPPPPPEAPVGPPPVVAAVPPAMKKGGKVKKVKKAKGGACKKMAAGGAAKERKGYPDTTAPQKLAKGGSVRGCGVATRGTGFSGIY